MTTVDEWLDEGEHKVDLDVGALVTATPKTEVLTLKERLELDAQSLRQDAELAAERIQGLENKLFEKSMLIVDGVLSFTDLDPENPMEIPLEWIKELGQTAAEKRHFAATQGLKNGKEAPMALKVAENMASTIIRARATEKAAPRSLSIETVVLQVKPQSYPELIVDEEQGDDDEDY